MVKKAVVLAGGKGTRLLPLTLETPKPLITVHRRAVLSWLCELFARAGVREIKVIISSEDLQEFQWWLKRFEAEYSGDIPAVSFFLESEPLGTFGGLKLPEMREWLGGEAFFMSNGDELKNLDLVEMGRQHISRVGAAATMALAEVADPREYGVAVLDGDKITGFVEKPAEPPSHYINAGLYLLGQGIFDYADREKFQMIEGLFDRVARDGRLWAFRFSDGWYDCGTFERWERAIREWQF